MRLREESRGEGVRLSGGLDVVISREMSAPGSEFVLLWGPKQFLPGM